MQAIPQGLVLTLKSVVLCLEVFEFLHELDAVSLFALQILLQLLLFPRDAHVLQVVKGLLPQLFILHLDLLKFRILCPDPAGP